MNQSKNKEYTISLRNKYVFIPEKIEVKDRKVIGYSGLNKNSYTTYYVETYSSEVSCPKDFICLHVDNQIDVFITHNDYEYFKKFDKNIYQFSGLKIQHEVGMVCMNIIIDIPFNSLNKTSFLTEKIYELLPSAFIYDGEIPERKLRNDITLVIDTYLDENFTTIDFLGFCKFFDPNLSEFENEDQKRCYIIKGRQVIRCINMGKMKDLEVLTEQRNIIPFDSNLKSGFYEIKIDKELHEKILELLSMVNKLTDIPKGKK